MSVTVSDHEDLDQALIDAFFCEVMNAENPEELIPPSLYELWKASIAASQYANQSLVDLAAEINLTWPTTRIDEKVADFLDVEIAAVKQIPAFGRKKSRTLILCIALAAYKADKAAFTSYKPIVPAISFEELLASDRPAELISEDIWNTWCQSINSSPAASTKIAEMANRLRLDWPYSKRDDRFAEYSKLSLSQVLNLPGYGSKKIKSLILCFAALIFTPTIVENPHLPDPTADNAWPMSAIIDHDQISSFIRYELARLSEREQLVTNRRYCIASESSATLEEIAVELGVTRERVRQILIGVVEKIKISSIGMQLPELIARLDIDGLWATLANQYGVIFKADVNRAFERKLRGEFALALDCCDISVSKWLSTIATEGPHCWYRSTYTPEELLVLLQKLEEFIRQTDLPLPLATISRHLGVTVQEAGMVICLSTEYKLYEGYVFEGRLAPRPRRTAHLHRLLNNEETFILLHDLKELHNKVFPTEPCSTRDAEIVMREAPHMFVQLGDRGWCSIGNYGVEPLESPAQVEPCNTAEDQIPSESTEETSVAAVIKNILQERGLTNFVDIVKEFMAQPGNTYSENSVAPILSNRDEFVKFAPSVPQL